MPGICYMDDGKAENPNMAIEAISILTTIGSGCNPHRWRETGRRWYNSITEARTYGRSKNYSGNAQQELMPHRLKADW